MHSSVLLYADQHTVYYTHSYILTYTRVRMYIEINMKLINISLYLL